MPAATAVFWFGALIYANVHHYRMIRSGASFFSMVFVGNKMGTKVIIGRGCQKVGGNFNPHSLLFSTLSCPGPMLNHWIFAKGGRPFQKWQYITKSLCQCIQVEYSARAQCKSGMTMDKHL